MFGRCLNIPLYYLIKVKGKWSTIKFDVFVLSFIFFAPMSQTIRVISYFLQTSNYWHMWWHLHMRSHKPNGEDCILETMGWYHVDQTCNVMCKCKRHDEIKLIIYWLDQRCNDASVAEIFPETLKYWVGVQRDQSYLMGRRCLFSLGWSPF